MGIWGDTYNRALARGEDHGSAAFLADQAEARKLKKDGKRFLHLRNEGDRMIVEVDGKEVINTHCPTVETAISEIVKI